MVKIRVYNYKRDKNVLVDVENVSDKCYEMIKDYFIDQLDQNKPYYAIAEAFVYAVELCPTANPSDIWQHIIYRTYIQEDNNEQSWKRASGQGFEVAFVKIYNPRFAVYGIRLVVLSKTTAILALKK